jgi:mono/diheme cytochrome c family protein
MSDVKTVVAMLGLAACAGGDPRTESATQAVANLGEQVFSTALPHTNGRSCATCHIAADHFALTPQHVQAVFASNPNDPLFNRIDADDPAAAVPTYNHLKAGLVRVTVPLAGNLDVIDGAGNVITNAGRTVSVWRSVPSIENVAYTAPYQLDGRAPSLGVQALGALRAHSQINPDPPQAKTDLIASFERGVFSSQAAADVAYALANGQTPAPVDLHLPAGSAAAAGQAVFLSVCARCHGSPTTNVIGEQTVFDSFFPVLNADGTVDIAGFLPTGVAIPSTFMVGVQAPHEGTLGISAIGLLGQLGVLPNPSGLDFPQIRIRFYTDATRAHTLVDMPPAPPGIGPSLVPEPFTVDPGRSIVSGDPIDWEGFDVPQLRGIAQTAPYFHDGSAPNLAALVDEYSRLILPADPVLNLPPVFPPEGPGLPPEALSTTDKANLVAFLQLL